MANRFLIVQLADIGDLIVSTPALAALREAHPDAHIALLTTSHAAPVVNGTNLVDEIITFDKGQFNSSRAFFRPGNLRRIFNLRHSHYDTVLFFHHFTLKLGTLKFALIALATGAKRRIGLDNGNGWFLTERLPDSGFGAKHQAQYWLDLVGLLGADTTPRPAQINIAQAFYNTGGRDLLVDFGVKKPARYPEKPPLIVIHAGSGGYSKARRWDTSKFAQVADQLVDEYQAEILLVGTPDDNGAAVKAAMRHEPIDMIGKTKGLDVLARLIADADLFIGADSGVMHIAASTGTPIVAVFGPSNPNAWSPWTPDGKSIVVRSAPECSPCSYVGHGVGLRDGCPARTCIRMVTPEDVMVAARQILEGHPRGNDQNPSSTKHVFHKRIRILDLPVDAITYAEWLDLIDHWVKNTTTARHVCTINPEFMMIARQDVNFRNILNRADLCVPDGVGLLWAARRRGHPLPERVTGSDGVPKIAERAALTGWRLFFLGAAPGVADKAADILYTRYPGLSIVGIHSGSPAPDEEDAIVQMVNDSGADILFVAYGAPEQDKWIARNLPRLQVKMAMGVGGAFDFIAGVVPRAPLWMRRMGLEWLFRLYLQPWRIRRMLRLPCFVLAVILEKQSAISHQPSAKN
jgi:N-acetylglucosaminyldiphosphoundecaprenol N-acetyl-beta-D-mannosaminyltransferase